MPHPALIDTLLHSDNPSVRWKVRVGVLDDDPASQSVRDLAPAIRTSATVEALLSRRDPNGRIKSRRSVYDKWQGAHWVFAALAEVGYPARDKTLQPLRDQVFEHWLQPHFYHEFTALSRAQAYREDGVPVMYGRHRRCASQQGNALLSATRLGLLNADAKRLVERLLHWQWPDGGWNCDKEPSADTSSFMESVLPMRALALYGRTAGDARATRAAWRAAEALLTRQLFRRASDGAVIKPAFTQLHYPNYWHYDVLAGLRAMADVGVLGDPRCAAALDLLEAKQLPGGGWAAEARYFKPSKSLAHGNDHVDWGGASKRKPNEWLTAEALSVLHTAGRI
jgi:hypothetical protein